MPQNNQEPQIPKSQDKGSDFQKHNKPEELKDQAKEEMVPEVVAELIRLDVLKSCCDNKAMPDVRRSINESAQKWSKGFTPDQMKELSLALRTKFERMKQFAEASHQEVIALTSQIGW